MTTPSHTELAARLREAHDLSLDGHHRDARVAILEVAAALESPTPPERVQGEAAINVTAFQCYSCGHAGINDESVTHSACSRCEWSGPSPEEDRCPACSQVGTMTSSCPNCTERYNIMAEARFPAAAPPTAPAQASEGAAMEALKAIIQCDDDAKAAHGFPGANLNGYGLVDLFDSVGHHFGAGPHKQQPYRSNSLNAALEDGRAALRASTPAERVPGGITRDDTVHGETYYTEAQMRAALGIVTKESST